MALTMFNLFNNYCQMYMKPTRIKIFDEATIRLYYMFCFYPLYPLSSPVIINYSIVT